MSTSSSSRFSCSPAVDDGLSDDGATPTALPTHFLTTNEPPSDDEEAEIRLILSALHTHIAALDKSMARVEGVLARMRRMRRAALAQVRRGEAVLGVMRRLPADVLGEIFMHTLPDADAAPGRRATERSPWVLGRVSSRWRAVSCTLPRLW
ncbi:hypothetical protein GGX14DRAFT_360886, partial [Mycena pura]